MYPRTNYEMTPADLERILDACKPVPMIMLQCGAPRSQQEIETLRSEINERHP